MQIAALKALINAYQAHPDDAMLALILDGPEDDDARQAVAAFLDHLAPDQVADTALRHQVAEAALTAGAPGTALKFAESLPGAASKLLQARGHLAKGDKDQGRRLYDEAVAENAALQDTGLEKQLKSGGDGTQESTPEDEGLKAANVISLAGRMTRTETADGTLSEGSATISQLDPKSATTVTFADVGGLEDVKKQIHRRIILPFLKPSLYQKFKRRAGGGVLLYGPPGCGKTLLARATAGECNARFINVAISEVLDMYIGESEKRLVSVFEEARQNTPAVLFFDELEALAARRRYGSNDASASLVSTFLSELDGFEDQNEGVLVLAATNVPWAVDSAFRRSGRFDRLHFVPPPDLAARKAILQLQLADLPGGRDIDIEKIAKSTGGFSGADLKNLTETATDLAIENSLDVDAEQPLTQAMFDVALQEVKPTTLEWLTTARNYARYSNASGQYDDVLTFLEKHGR